MATMDNSIRQEDRLSVRQLADLIGLSPKTVYGMVQRNEVPHYRRTARGKVWFIRAEIEKWEQARWKVEAQ